MQHKDGLDISVFKTIRSWETWLAKNHQTSKGVWIRVFKKDSGIRSITHKEALEVALCYGWIDCLANKYDEDSYLQRFTPRRNKSIWSKKNIDNVEKLIQEGKMKPAGQKEIDAAKIDGRWDKAYDSPANAEIPADFLVQLKKDKKAYAFFQSLNKSNTYAITWRLQTARKAETRDKRMKLILQMLKDGKTFH